MSPSVPGGGGISSDDPISPVGGGISPGEGMPSVGGSIGPYSASIAASTESPAASKACIGSIPESIAVENPSDAEVTIVFTISGGAPISVIMPAAASIAAEAASTGLAPLSSAAV